MGYDTVIPNNLGSSGCQASQLHQAPMVSSLRGTSHGSDECRLVVCY